MRCRAAAALAYCLQHVQSTDDRSVFLLPALPSPPCLQWKEMVGEASQRITRPRQIYTGELRRKFVAASERQISGCISGE